MNPPLRINIDNLESNPKAFTGNQMDAVPTMAYAVSAYKKAAGRTDNRYFQEYIKAMNHFAQVYGREAATHLQEVAVNAGSQDGDVEDALQSYSRTAIATKQPVNQIVKNLLVLSDQGQKPLSHFGYAFDDNVQDVPQAGTANMLDNIRRKLSQ